jgi:hypothetical protein
MTIRIPKFRKENYPERAKNGGNQFFDDFSILTLFTHLAVRSLALSVFDRGACLFGW